MKKIKDNILTVITTSIVTMFPMLVGLLLWNRLPNSIATHFAIDGTPNGFSSKTFTVFGLTGILLCVQLFILVALSLEGKGKDNINISDRVYRLVLWISPVSSVYVSAAIYSCLLYTSPSPRDS